MCALHWGIPGASGILLWLRPENVVIQYAALCSAGLLPLWYDIWRCNYVATSQRYLFCNILFRAVIFASALMSMASTNFLGMALAIFIVGFGTCGASLTVMIHPPVWWSYRIQNTFQHAAMAIVLASAFALLFYTPSSNIYDAVTAVLMLAIFTLYIGWSFVVWNALTFVMVSKQTQRFWTAFLHQHSVYNAFALLAQYKEQGGPEHHALLYFSTSQLLDYFAMSPSDNLRTAIIQELQSRTPRANVAWTLGLSDKEAVQFIRQKDAPVQSSFALPEMNIPIAPL